jgi:hypothetical protein
VFGIEKYLPAALCSFIRVEACHKPTLYINLAGDMHTSLHFDRSCTTFDLNNQSDDDSHDGDKHDPGKNNLFVQLTGSRKFVLFPPHCSEDMMPFPEKHLNHISQSTTFLHRVAEHSPDLDQQLEFIASSQFPFLAKPWQQRLEITLQAGDALLIPTKWWHYTQLLTPSVALNWWFLKSCFKVTK